MELGHNVSNQIAQKSSQISRNQVHTQLKQVEKAKQEEGSILRETPAVAYLLNLASTETSSILKVKLKNMKKRN